MQESFQPNGRGKIAEPSPQPSPIRWERGNAQRVFCKRTRLPYEMVASIPSPIGWEGARVRVIRVSPEAFYQATRMSTLHGQTRPPPYVGGYGRWTGSGSRELQAIKILSRCGI